MPSKEPDADDSTGRIPPAFAKATARPRRSSKSGGGQRAKSCRASLNGKVAFCADDGEHGRELWISDGTEQGTSIVADLEPGQQASAPQNLVAINGTLFFRARTRETGIEPWKSNGTAAGTGLVHDINLGAASSTVPRIAGDFPIQSGTTIYFAAVDGTHGREPWVVPFRRPELVAPNIDETLPEGSTTFSWMSNGSPVTQWWLYMGTRRGTSDLVNQPMGLDVSYTVDSLPSAGSDIFVRLWFRTHGSWRYEDYIFKAATTGGQPELTRPTNGDQLVGPNVVFEWQSNGASVSDWWLWAGTKPGSSDLDRGSSLGGDARSAEILELPTDGSPIYIRLWFLLPSRWQFEDYNFIAAN